MGRNILFLLFHFFLASSLTAQNPDSLFAKINASLALPDSVANTGDLFLQLDKTIYHSSDEIWFNAFLLNSAEVNQHHTIHVLLINDMTGKLVSLQRYVMESGLAAGNVEIPDTLETGEYSLVAYTNRFLDIPGQTYFRQPVTVLSKRPPFDIRFLPSDAQSIQNDSLTVMCKLVSAGGGIGALADLDFTLYADGKPLRSLRLKSDAFGEVPLKLSMADCLHSLEIRGKIIKGDVLMHFKQAVLWESPLVFMSFFPEGGTLIAGQPSRIALHVRTSSGKAIATKGVLLEANKPVLNFTTDQYGMGFLNFTGKEGAAYKAVLQDEKEIIPVQQFPAVKTNGYSLRVLDSKIYDSLELMITTPASNNRAILMAYNSKEALFSVMLEVPGGKGRLKIPAIEWPEGVTQIAFFDDKGNLKQVRSVVKKFDNRIAVSVVPDSANHSTRSQSYFRLSLRDSSGKPLTGMFSVGITLSKTLSARALEIQRYQYYDRLLNSDFSLPPYNYLLSGSSESIFIEQAGKSLYNWPLRPLPLAKTYDGYVERNNRQLKRPVEILAVAGEASIFTTDSSGRFVLPPAAIRGKWRSRTLVSVASESTSAYSLTLSGRGKELNDSIAAKYHPLYTLVKDELSYQEKEAIRKLKGEALTEVVVKGRNADRNYNNGRGSNLCNDYVCSYGILNCMNHGAGTPGNSTPVEGRTYRGPGGMMTVYHCSATKAEQAQVTDAVWFPPTFYQLDIHDKEIPPDVLNRTTLYWNPQMATNDKGEAEIRFYTNDVVGKFTITVQGISMQGVFSGSAEFMVR